MPRCGFRDDILKLFYGVRRYARYDWGIAQDQTLLNVSYDPTRELYVQFNEAFARHWNETSGGNVTIEQSHAGSGKQAQAVIDGLSALAYTLQHLAAMFLMADTHDIDRALGDKSGQWFVSRDKGGRVITSFADGRPQTADGARIDEFDPTIFIFDSYPGGIGFSQLLYNEHSDLLAAAKSLIARCPCAWGCPSCVGPTLEVGKSAKEIVPKIIELVLKGQV